MRSSSAVAGYAALRGTRIVIVFSKPRNRWLRSLDAHKYHHWKAHMLLSIVVLLDPLCVKICTRARVELHVQISCKIFT